MPIIPVGFGQVSFIFAGSGVPRGAAVTLGFANPGNDSPSVCAVAFRSAFEDNIMPVLVQNTGLSEVLVKVGPNDTGASATVGSSVAGGDTSAQASPAVTYLVTKNTALGGRRGRGRWYLPGVDETVVGQGGVVDPAKVTALQAGVDGFITDIQTSELYPALLHDVAQIWTLVDGQPRRVDDPDAPAPPAPTGIASMTVEGVVATQRRRQRG